MIGLKFKAKLFNVLELNCRSRVKTSFEIVKSDSLDKKLKIKELRVKSITFTTNYYKLGKNVPNKFLASNVKKQRFTPVMT